MGGRGAASGVSDKGKVYGTEYKTLLQDGDIKFVQYKDGNPSKVPMETMTKGRIYAVVNQDNELKSLAFYDEKGKRYKQIDITGKVHTIDGKPELPHTHFGYIHDEYNEPKKPNAKEKKLIDRAKAAWYNHINK